MSDAVTRLSSALSDRYRIERQLGEGGMATVYLAGDVKHNRKVAIKVLRPELAAVLGADRFVQEITTTAQLQHPHILPLFDSGSAHGFLYYVMPYVEGETLRDKLNRETQLSIEEAVRITTEVADALDYAHRHGVIHRDIKPENILLHDGRPVVADFGIALALSAAAGGRMTETGMSLGTPHYMSPEQATADKDITARSDIYSLGSVLYEMLTGNPPHTGSSAQQIIMKIIAEPVAAVTTLRKSVPPNVAAALGKALEKLPADRFDSARAFMDALSNPAFHHGATASEVTAGLRPRRSRVWQAIAAGSLLVGGAAGAALGWLARTAKPTPPLPVVRMYVEGDSTFQVTNACCGPSLAISRDGRRIVFMARSSGLRMLYRRDLDDAVAHPVPGTDSAFTPFLDPTGRWLGFAKNGHLVKTDLSGGTPLNVADVGTSSIWGATWADDGFIYFVPQRGESEAGIYRVSDQGGSPKLVSAPDTSVEANRVSPAALPGGRGLLYVSWPKTGGDAAAWVAVLKLKDGTSRRLTPGIQPYYADGHLVYALADGSIMARPFDLGSLKVTGDAVRIGENVITHNASDTEYAVSRSGTLVTRHGGTVGGRVGGATAPATGASVATLRLYPLTGPPPLKIFDAQRSRGMPTFSPNGRYLAFLEARSANVDAIDLWVQDLATGLPSRLSTGNGYAISPVWSADSRSVRWIQYRDSAGSVVPGGILSRPVDLSRPVTSFAPKVAPIFTSSRRGSRVGTTFGLPSRSGGPIPYETPDATGNLDLWIMNADGGDPHPFLRSQAQEMEPAVSPSGKWVAYVSDETGQDEVWVEPFPAGGPRFRISQSGGDYPVWVSDREIVFMALNVVVLANLDVAPTRVRATGYRSVVDLVSTDWGLRPLDGRPDGRAIVVVSVTGTGRLLVETNRLAQLGPGPAGR